MLSVLAAHAGIVDRNAAGKIAQSLLRKAVSLSTESEVKARNSAVGAPSYYIFNAADGKGFVIVSGESEMPEIIGYSMTSSADVDKLPPALEDALGEYSAYVERVRAGIITVPVVTSVDESEEVAPLCQTQWGQGTPYNNLVPKINGESCPSGCVATALSQIMAYHKWPDVGEGSKWYNPGISGYKNAKYDFAQHTYNWDLMKNTTAENNSDAAAAAEVAQLLWDCGVAVDMGYAIGGSGAYTDLSMMAMYNYFGYKASTLDHVIRFCFETQEEWNELLKNELRNSRPVQYSASSKSGGHSFVIDGFNKKGFFHVNWGWDGEYDGYYEITSLNGFSENHSMICGIQPDSTRTDKVFRQFRPIIFGSVGVTADSVALGSTFNFTLGGIQNFYLTYHQWVANVALYDLNGKKIVNTCKTAKSKRTYNLGGAQYTTSQNYSCIIPDTVSEGKYELRVVFCHDGYSEYILPDVNGGSYLNALPVYIRDGVAYFNEASAISKAQTSVPSIVRTEYFTLDGRRLSTPSAGICVVRKTFSDGSVYINKVYK